MSGPPPISVVLPCRNEAATIGATLASLIAQESPPTEILVIDDGSTDGSQAVVTGFAATAPLPIRLLEGPQRGVSFARNLGAARATGALLVFAEGDARYPVNYLADAAAALRDPEVGGSSGGRRVMWAPRGSRLARTWNCLYRARWDLIRRGRTPPLGAWAFRRADFLRWGGYDETLIVGEDRDLVERVRAAGKRIAFFPDGLFCHRDPQTLDATLRRFFWGGRHSLTFRRRWRNLQRDILGAVLLIALTLMPLVLLCVSIPAAGAAALALGAGPLVVREVRLGLQVALAGRDLLAAVLLPPLYYLTKLASAFGIIVAAISDRRAAD